MLTLLYNTGARVSETAALKVGDVRLDGAGAVHLHGKGRKERHVPLWRESISLVRRWLKLTRASADPPLLPNSRGEHLTRSGVEHRLRVALLLAAEENHR
jgi:site-specific recombinase XerD